MCYCRLDGWIPRRGETSGGDLWDDPAADRHYSRRHNPACNLVYTLHFILKSQISPCNSVQRSYLKFYLSHECVFYRLCGPDFKRAGRKRVMAGERAAEGTRSCRFGYVRAWSYPICVTRARHIYLRGLWQT